ncbi:DEAD/DEAH box helicase [Tundrisphaera lichenicola]|uniref:DEAD/DEAH box helicase n=1 Tax=Tundrisphaera lichenicola TaxID=2029860 RepID=UPI003EB82B28
MQLRDYQQRAIEGLFQYFEHASGNPLIVAPTGSGKSVIIGALCKLILETWPDQRLMVLSHVKELLEQNYGKIVSFWPKAPAGLYSAGLGQKSPRDPITVASIQSAFRKPHIFGWRDLLLIDECHLLSPDSDGMYRQFIDGLKEINPRLKVVGLTATAYRLKTGMLHEGKGRLFTDIAVEISLQELLEAGHISPLISKSSVVQADLSEVGMIAGEFNARDSETAMDKEALTAAALDEVFALAGDRRSWLFFCAGVGHAEHVAEALRLRGVDAATVTGETPDEERDAILKAFKAGTLRAVTNANVLTTGFDAPNIDLLVLLRPTTSPGLYTQILGRGMRTAPGKRNCLVLDYAGNIERHGPITHVKPPRAAGTRGKRESHERSCLICPDCRMASPLGALECADCGREFTPPERINHGTTASTGEVMALGDLPQPYLGEWMRVDSVSYHKHEKPDKIPTMRVEYHCGINTYREWICLEHAPGFARGKAVDWWKRRSPVEPPDSIGIALYYADALKKTFAIRVKKGEKFWEITGYDLTGFTITEPAEETGADTGAQEPIDFLGEPY